MLRQLVAKLSEIFRKRVSSPRLETRESLPVKITLPPPAVAVMSGETGSDRRIGTHEKQLSMNGKVRDLSHDGIAFIVPLIRLGENYLVGENKILNAEISLPAGVIIAQIRGERYNPLGEQIPATEYLIGARIVWMSQADRKTYQAYLDGDFRQSSKQSFVSKYDEQTG